MNHSNPYNINEQDIVDAQNDVRAFELLPAGEYVCVITKADERQTKDGTGMYLAFEITIDDGQHKGRKVWDNLNIVNKSPQAQAIARKNYAALCVAIGAPRGVSGPHDLCFKRFVARIGVKPPQNGYEASNKIDRYIMTEMNSHTQYSQAPTQAAPQRGYAPQANPQMPPAQTFSAPKVSSDGGWTV